MTEEEIKALQDAKEAAETAAKEALEVARVATEEKDKAQGDVVKIVDELKEERVKKQEAIDKAKLSNGEIDVNEIIESAFKEREDKGRKASFEKAMSDFKESKPEFQADSAGLVYDKFEDGLKRFNFSDVQTEGQMKARLEEAYSFLNPTAQSEGDSHYEGSSSLPAPTSEAAQSQSLAEKKVMENTGMKEERYKEMKAKYPDAFESLGLN